MGAPRYIPRGGAPVPTGYVTQLAFSTRLGYPKARTGTQNTRIDIVRVCARLLARVSVCAQLQATRTLPGLTSVILAAYI